MRLVWLGVVLAGCGVAEPVRPEVAPEPVHEAPPPSVAPAPPGPTLEPEGGASPASAASSPVKQVLKANKRSLMGCHEAALQANPSVMGQIELRWTITAGSAKDVVPLRNTTGDDALAKCVAAQISAWNFAGAEEGVVQNTWYFEAMQPPGVDAQPNAGPDGVQQVVKANRGQLLGCHQEALRSHAAVAGDLRVTWTLAGGEVTEAQVDANTTGDKGLESCVLSKLRRWKFTGIEDGRVTQTFVFQAPEP
jgi:hypothetical protein